MSNSTTPHSEARLRRRPARYSPDLMQPNSSSNSNNNINNNNSNSSRNNSGADSSQLQYQTNGSQDETTVVAGSSAAAAADPHQDELLRLAALAEKGLLPEGSDNNQTSVLTTRSKTPRINSAGYKKRKYTRRKGVNNAAKNSNNGSFVNNVNGKEQPQQRSTPQPPAKRPRVANVLLENEMLIDEIKIRKALWMRTHDQHHSNLLTAPLWEEIANILDSTPENVKRRWKSMKDHYRRELKKEMTDPAAPQSPWPYYKKMKFMKSQMFVSMRRTEGDQELEILSADEEDLTNEWQNSLPRKREMLDDSEAMDQYSLESEMSQLVKYENRVVAEPNSGEVDDSQEEMDQQQMPEEEEEEEEEGDQEADQDDEHDALQEEGLQDQSPLNSTITSMGNLVHMPNMTTTTASALSQRMSMEHQNQQLNGMMNQSQTAHINNDLNGMSASHSVMQQHINNRISNIQTNPEIQQRVSIDALRRQNEMSALQQQVHINRLEPPQIQQPVNNGENLSDDYHFFMSLIPHVRHFTSIQKLKVRSRIQQIILEEISNSHDPLAN